MKDLDPVEQGPALCDVRSHVARMPPSYAAAFSEQEIARHAALAARIDAGHPVAVDAQATNCSWRVTIVGYDYPGDLSLICGLLFVHGLNIASGDVYTYEPLSRAPLAGDVRRKIADVFAVTPAGAAPPGRPRPASCSG